MCCVPSGLQSDAVWRRPKVPVRDQQAVWDSDWTDPGPPEDPHPGRGQVASMFQCFWLVAVPVLCKSLRLFIVPWKNIDPFTIFSFCQTGFKPSNKNLSKIPCVNTTHPLQHVALEECCCWSSSSSSWAKTASITGFAVSEVEAFPCRTRRMI